MAEATVLVPGTRVRLTAPTPLLTLRSDCGTVVARDAYKDYYVVRLDEPALLRHSETDPPTVLEEVVEMADNLEILPTHPPPHD